MSRTYRKVPHFLTKESLRKDFEEGSYRIFHCGMTFKDANDYAKTAMAKERTDSGVFHDSGLSDVMGIAPNGSPLGYKEWSRSDGWAKRYANKVRRNNDKAIVAGAIDEMIEDFDVAMQELAHYEDDYRDCYEEYLEEPYEALEWDDPRMYDDPYEEPYYDDRWDDYDPMW